MGGFYGLQAAYTIPHTVPVTSCCCYIYHSHSCITRLGQLYSMLEPLGRGRLLCAPKGGVMQLSLGIHLVGIDPNSFQKAEDL